MSLLDLAPPHSVEAEQGVIGGLMLDNSTWVNRPGFFRHLANSLRNVFQTLPVTADC